MPPHIHTHTHTQIIAPANKEKTKTHLIKARDAASDGGGVFVFALFVPRLVQTLLRLNLRVQHALDQRHLARHFRFLEK